MPNQPCLATASLNPLPGYLKAATASFAQAGKTNFQQVRLTLPPPQPNPGYLKTIKANFGKLRPVSFSNIQTTPLRHTNQLPAPHSPRKATAPTCWLP